MITIQELNQIKEETAKKMNLKIQVKEDSKDKKHVLICDGPGCHSSGSTEVKEAFELKIREAGLEDKIKVDMVGCFGLCETGPNAEVYPDATFYSHITEKNIEDIVKKHLRDGEVVEEIVYEGARKDGEIKPVTEVDFYSKQEKIALRNCGLIDYESIEEYIALDGYQALSMVISEMSQEEVIDVMKEANLRGRGGAGFPAGIKWETAFKYPAEQKYVICNADEGDPGAFMDRSILEGDPHSVLEAMAISGYAIGSNQGYIYIRAEYPVAVNRLRVAIKQANDMGLLGENILGTDFSFNIDIRLGAGAFVCGEGTALMESIEGKRGMPRTKVHRTAHKGLWGMPTIINNVETFANVPIILRKGAEWFKSIGTEDSPGTKVFALGGKIKNTGLVEVPMGTTLREIIFDIGGGIPHGKKFKAVQTGGPSGGCIPEELIDTPVDFASLKEIGSIMGSGGMIVLNEDDCMVDIARFFLEFSVEESCGKCVPCREGTKRMLEILERITEGEGKAEDLDTLESLAETIVSSSLCGLGQTAPNPVLSTLKYFRHEYEAHIFDKKCPAGSCEALTEYFITDGCIGCTKCIRSCPVDAITGAVRQLHVIDTETCIKCGVCAEVCPVDAIIRR